jgi:uncharacterized protein
LTATKSLNVVSGMRCNGCETIIERAVSKVSGVGHVKADYSRGVVEVVFDSEKTSLAQIRAACSAAGYPSGAGSGGEKREWTGITLSLLALVALVLAVLLARKFGGNIKLPEIDSGTGGGMIFVFGLFTGLHCVGMCGSFVIGYCAKDAQQGCSALRSHILFCTGKILSYALVGALFGFAGRLLGITPLVSGISIGLAGAFLILYGLSMLNIFSGLKAFRLKGAEGMERQVVEKGRRNKSPFFIGFFSGFILGCGPLQAMYIMAAGNGSMLQGAKLLALFALGTLPALVCFGLLARILSNLMTRRLVQASGLILVALGAFMLNRGIARAAAVNEAKAASPCCHGVEHPGKQEPRTK